MECWLSTPLEHSSCPSQSDGFQPQASVLASGDYTYGGEVEALRQPGGPAVHIVSLRARNRRVRLSVRQEGEKKKKKKKKKKIHFTVLVYRTQNWVFIRSESVYLFIEDLGIRHNEDCL